MAQALIHNPEVLVLDEPTDGLDPNQKHEVRKLITRLGTSKAIIISTHILEEVNAICNRAMIIANGKLLIDDSPDKILSKSQTYGDIIISIKGIKNSELKKELMKLDQVKNVQIRNNYCWVSSKYSSKTKEIILKLVKKKSWKIEHFSLHKGNLDEIFRSYTSTKSIDK